MLAGLGRFGLYGGLVLLESVSRVAVGVLLVIGVSGVLPNEPQLDCYAVHR